MRSGSAWAPIDALVRGERTRSTASPCGSDSARVVPLLAV